MFYEEKSDSLEGVELTEFIAYQKAKKLREAQTAAMDATFLKECIKAFPLTIEGEGCQGHYVNAYVLDSGFLTRTYTAAESPKPQIEERFIVAPLSYTGEALTVEQIVLVLKLW